MSTRIKPYVLKLTPREMIFIEDGLRCLVHHLREIHILRPQSEAEIMLVLKKIKEVMNE